MKFFVYIIKSLQTGNYYTGMTNDLMRRLEEHNQGLKSTPTTYGKGPFYLVHAEEHSSRTNARKRELFWKSGYGRELRDKFDKYMGD